METIGRIDTKALNRFELSETKLFTTVKNNNFLRGKYMNSKNLIADPLIKCTMPNWISKLAFGVRQIHLLLLYGVGPEKMISVLKNQLIGVHTLVLASSK